MSSLETPETISVPDAARLIGVSRQRLHDRLGRKIAALDCTRTTRTRHDYRVPTSEALAWRAEREANGLPVGPIPAEWMPHDVPDVPPMPIGLMVWRPF